MEVASPSGSLRSEASTCIQSADIKDAGPKLDSKKQIHHLKRTNFGEISVDTNILRGHSHFTVRLKYVPADDDESLDESATEPLIEDAEEMAAMLDLVQENAIVRRKDII